MRWWNRCQDGLWKGSQELGMGWVKQIEIQNIGPQLNLTFHKSLVSATMEPPSRVYWWIEIILQSPKGMVACPFIYSFIFITQQTWRSSLYTRHCANGKIEKVGRDQTTGASEVKFCIHPKSKWKSLNESEKSCNLTRLHMERRLCHCAEEREIGGGGHSCRWARWESISGSRWEAIIWTGVVQK